MKRLISLLLIMVIGLSGCTSAPQEPMYTQDEVDAMIIELQNDLTELQADTLEDVQALENALLDYYSQEEVDTLLQETKNLLDLYYTKEEMDLVVSNVNDDLEVHQAYIDELEEILVNLGVIEGLNGQQEWYIADNTNPFNVLAYELLGDELDKSKAPTYILDENDEYIPYNDVAVMLVQKYYGIDTNQYLYETFLNSRVGFKLDTNNLTADEFVARTVLLIEELSNYDFYVISSSFLYIQVNNYEQTAYITIPISTLRSSFITWDASLFINEMYEVDITNLTFDINNVQALYNGYVTNGTFDGYVLNY